MERLIAARESLKDEPQERPILLVRTVKERADVTFPAEHGTGDSKEWFADMLDGGHTLVHHE